MSNRRVNKKRRRRLKKTPFVILILIIFLIVGAIVIKNNIKDDSEVLNNSSNVSSTVVNAEQKAEIERLKAEAEKWYLLLVNDSNPLSEDFVPETVELPSKYLCGNLKEVDSRIAQAFMDMCDAALEEGVSLRARSPYRAIETQKWLFENEVTKWENQGLSREEAEEKAATIVARPGTSEHATGLAIDINLSDQSFEQTDAFSWLQKNAAKYGFVLRYPENKQDVTGIIYESWHYRYVSPEHAKEMNRLGLCLEEYVEYLKSGGEILE